VHLAKKPRCLPARRLEAEFASSLNGVTDTVDYESPTQKLFKKLEQQKHDVEQTVAKKQKEVFELESSFKRRLQFFQETVVFKLPYFRAQQNYVLLRTLLFCYNM